jgi:uncharacterized iron-regulated membrane protein
VALRRVRAFLFWVHLSAGVAAGLVILVMSATGAALAFKPQIVNLIDADIRIVEPGRGPRLPPRALIVVAQGERPDAPPASFTMDRDPTAAAAVGMGRGATVYMNPYTGAVLGAGSEAAEAFFRSVENWHRWLAVSGEGRSTARAMTGAANLAFLFLAISGLYVWWPRKWTPQHTSPILFFRRAGTARARDFNWHNVIGFWCAPAIIVMTFSGVVMSYPWANNMLYRALGSTPPNQVGQRGAPTAGREERAPAIPEQLDSLWAQAEQKMPTWGTITVRFANRAGVQVTFSISDGASWNRFARSQLALDAATGDVRQWQPYDASSLGQKARGWLRFAHTGELGGLAGQFLAGIGCLGGVVLVYTGLALAIRRFLNWGVWSERMPARAGTSLERVR